MKPNQSIVSRAAGILTLGWSDSPRGRRCLRRMVSKLVRSLLRVRSRTLPDLTPGSVMVVAPHPDDESIGCGGTLALLRIAGAQLHIAFVTDGSASHPSHPVMSPEDIARARRDEARRATALLGVEWSRITFLGASDGKLAGLDGETKTRVIAEMANLLAAIVPGAVLLPCRSDGSSEHNAVFDLFSNAAAKAGQEPRILEFPVWAWRNPFVLIKPLFMSRVVWRVDLRSVMAVKAAAMDTYASQMRPIPPDTVPALPPEFISEFSVPEEFLFET